MRVSQFFFQTRKDIPNDAQIISHQLMLRGGFIQKLGSGLYTWLPLGLRVLHKIIKIVQEEMNRIGAQEILMPAMQPATLWQETGRWDKFGRELLKIKDRHNKDFCYGPTHEEVVADLVRQKIQSYKELPLLLYQIQTKFRDEIRPRFGIMRAREFLMKDAYSFHIERESLEKTYQQMYTAYSTIFERMGLNFRAVLADTGAIGGHASHEFHVLASSGEDLIAYSSESDYAANIELARSQFPIKSKDAPLKPKSKIETIGIKTIAELSQFLKVSSEDIVKTLIVKGQSTPWIAFLLKGEDELNHCKLEKIPEVFKPITFASPSDILTAFHCEAGFLGPIGLNIPIIADPTVVQLQNFICGANETNAHLVNVNFERDCEVPQTIDIRLVKEGDPGPDGKGILNFTRGIEVGHIFQLGNKYSQAMGVQATNAQGEHVALEMGCYGIGISRIAAACIEQHHDEFGIIWPESIAPFHIVIIPLQYHESQRVHLASDALYQQLIERGYDVLLDDRNVRPGIKFAEMDLIGIPHRLVLNERCLDTGMIEYKSRSQKEKKDLSLDEVFKFFLKK